MNMADDLRDQQRHLDQLVQLLGRERTLLGEGRIDGEALARIAADKQRMLEALAQFGRQPGQAGFAAGAQAREDAAREAGCLDAWQALRERAREAARMNQFNGDLIAVRMHSNRRLLNDLGVLAGNTFYGPDGGESRSGRSRLASQA